MAVLKSNALLHRPAGSWCPSQRTGTHTRGWPGCGAEPGQCGHDCTLPTPQSLCSMLQKHVLPQSSEQPYKGPPPPPQGQKWAHGDRPCPRSRSCNKWRGWGLNRGGLDLRHAVSLWMPGDKGVIATLARTEQVAMGSQPHTRACRSGSCRCVCVFVCVCVFNLFGCTRSLLWHVGSSSLTKDRTQAPCVGSKKS